MIIRACVLCLTMTSAPVVLADTLQLVFGKTTKTITTEDLSHLALSTIKTSTNFTPEATFEGVTFTTLLKSYGVQASQLRIFALDDYSYTLPVAELNKYGVILAYKKNGKNIPVSDLGPFAVIYPRDQHPELNNLEVNARTVWQINRIEAVDER